MKMNILMTTQFFQPHIGGIENHVYHLSNYLSEKGHNITIFTSLLPGTEKNENYDNIQVIRSKSIFLPDWPVSSMSSVGFFSNLSELIKKILKEKNIELVHAHGHHYPLNWSVINIAKKYGAPSILTLHGTDLLYQNNFLSNLINNIFNTLVFSKLLKNTDHVIALSNSIKIYARQYVNKNDLFSIIPNGINLHFFLEARKNRDSIRKKYGISKEKIVILFRGRFSDVKGVIELAKSAFIISQKYDNIYFLFVGDGPLKNKLEYYTKYFLKKSEIIGWVPDKEIPELYVISDIFILPSKMEALPITVIEAMASGLFIISTRVGGVPDILRNYKNKVYLDDTSISSIIKCLINVIDSYNYNNFFYKDMIYYDWEYIGKHIESIYKKLL